MINDMKTKTEFNTAMYNFCKKLTYNSHEYYKKAQMSYRPVYKTDGGRKYIKVKYFETNTVDQNGNKVISKGRIHCFVESSTGDIYKPATWKAPYTKGNNAVRGNIFDVTTFENTDPHGGWLYEGSSYNRHLKIAKEINNA
tara:strand:+ start:510 stop:932 length:423 start_codon:yes stop_codon:yes gene_type:complete